MTINDPELLGYREIHERMLPGIPIGTLRAMNSEGKMPPSTVIGRRRMWEKADVVAWIEGLVAAAK